MFNNQSSLTDADLAPELAAILQFKNTVTEEPREHEPEGQLSVDVLETPEEIIVVAAMAGTKSEDVELHLASDVLTIRGRRSAPVAGSNYFYRECFWGRFSRTIVLPTEVKSEHARAEYKNGVLSIWLPKARQGGTIPIMVVEE